MPQSVCKECFFVCNGTASTSHTIKGQKCTLQMPSRAYPDQSTASTSHPQLEFCHAMEELILTEHLPISATRLKQIQEATNVDHTLQTLKSQVISGWAQKKSEVPEVRPYMKCQDELSTQDGILFKGSRTILPSALHREMLQKIHEDHLRVESRREKYFTGH